MPEWGGLNFLIGYTNVIKMLKKLHIAAAAVLYLAKTTSVCYPSRALRFRSTASLRGKTATT